MRKSGANPWQVHQKSVPLRPICVAMRERTYINNNSKCRCMQNRDNKKKWNEKEYDFV